jgi:hypothetical protein
VVDPAAPDFVSGIKNRYVDPRVLLPDGAIVHATDLDPTLATRIADQCIRLATPIPLRVLRPAS